MEAKNVWPPLPLERWGETYDTLHLWSQIVGKIRLERTPWTNHSWHVPLYLTARGMSTSLIPYGTRTFELEFDFHDHQLVVRTLEGAVRTLPLRSMSVADFYYGVLRLLKELNLEVDIWPVPVELPHPIQPFHEHEGEAAYDPIGATQLWQILLHVHRVFTRFRAHFVGKASPIHLFWGAFDLAVTRFSGRPAPTHPGGAPNVADWVMQEAYSHEVSSAGFFLSQELGGAAFYSYAYPEPEGFGSYEVRPAEAYYHNALGEFILPYEAVRKATDPDAALLDFLQSTYEAAAELANWDRKALERELAQP